MAEPTQVTMPRAWWRLSIYPGCDPCVTVREEEAEFWRSEGLTVVELGDVAAERERCAKLCIERAQLSWAAADQPHAPEVKMQHEAVALAMEELASELRA